MLGYLKIYGPSSQRPVLIASRELTLAILPRHLRFIAVAPALVAWLTAQTGCGKPRSLNPQATTRSTPTAKFEVAAPVRPSLAAGEVRPSRSVPPGPSAESAPARSPPPDLSQAAGEFSPRHWIVPTASEGELRAAGVRRLEAKHLVLYTDVPSEPEFDLLPAYFDQAFPQWCERFGVDAEKHADWRITGCLMTDRAKFESLGLIPSSIRDFANGFALGSSLWLYDQTSPYYRRHLLLHEGTHAFLNTLANTRQPPASWYVEGLAELMATHQIENGGLALGWIPLNADDVHRWGRIEAIHKAFGENRAWMLPTLLSSTVIHHDSVEQYAWCWGLAVFLDRHPRYQARYRSLVREARPTDFREQFRTLFASDWASLEEDWQVFISELDYGYDFESSAVVREPTDAALGDKPIGQTITADRGWQATPWKLKAGTRFRITARGRYVVKAGPPDWESEPSGVTVRYYRGRPLGQLLGAIRGEFVPGTTVSGLTRPTPIGDAAILDAHTSGTLFLKVNEASSSLADNQGGIQVTVEEIGPTPSEAPPATRDVIGHR